MTARALAFLIWAAVATTAMFWGLRLLVTAPGAPPYTTSVGTSSGTAADLSRLLGREPVAAMEVAEAPASNRFQLLGIIAPKPGSTAEANGMAVISVDGKPARTYHVGGSLDADLVLQSVGKREAQLGPQGGPATATLTLPAPAAPATGTPARAAPGAFNGNNNPGPPQRPRMAMPNMGNSNTGAQPDQAQTPAEERIPAE